MQRNHNGALLTDNIITACIDINQKYPCNPVV